MPYLMENVLIMVRLLEMAVEYMIYQISVHLRILLRVAATPSVSSLRSSKDVCLYGYDLYLISSVARSRRNLLRNEFLPCFLAASRLPDASPRSSRSVSLYYSPSRAKRDRGQGGIFREQRREHMHHFERSEVGGLGDASRKVI